MQSRLPVIYLVVGVLLCLAGIGLVTAATFQDSTPMQLAGSLVFVGGVVLIIQARLTRLHMRINSIEEFLRQHACRVSAKYQGEDEEEPDSN
jgi:uncharacterized membrane protein HdeD (DUF308 family)